MWRGMRFEVKEKIRGFIRGWRRGSGLVAPSSDLLERSMIKYINPYWGKKKKKKTRKGHTWWIVKAQSKFY